MARRKNSRGSTTPKYRLHKSSGKAVVSIHGKDHYLGQHGTRESRAKYKRLIADLWGFSQVLGAVTEMCYENYHDHNSLMISGSIRTELVSITIELTPT